MGFWHTGYIEFHEPTGFHEGGYKPQPPVFPCSDCDQVFSSFEELRSHRFELHPLRRPMLFINNKELGTQQVRITRRLSLGDIKTANCEHAILNGEQIPVDTLSERLMQISSDICRVVLSGTGESAEFVLDFRIATDKHLAAIEEQFARLVRGRRLDSRAIEEFITAAKPYDTAIGYCDGICTYLYGVLAKEKSADSSLKYEDYPGRFSKAGDDLAAYDRPLARVIRSLVEFHFNHFREASLLADETRVGQAAGRFAALLRGERFGDVKPLDMNNAFSSLEPLVTDWETEQIARWAVSPLGSLSRDVQEIESFLERDLAEYDKVKLQILLAEVYASQGESARVREFASPLRNLAALEYWAESRIREHAEET